MTQHPDHTYIIAFTMNCVVFAKSQRPGNAYIIDFTMNSVVFTVTQHPDNTYIIAFAMNCCVFAKSQRPGNAYIIDFIMNSVVLYNDLASRQYIYHCFYNELRCFCKELGVTAQLTERAVSFLRMYAYWPCAGTQFRLASASVGGHI